MSDVAARAGVSVATVSRVLSGRNRVTEAKRRRVLAVVSELHYRPNTLARSLRIEATKTFGLVISDVLNPFFTELSRAVENAARDQGYTLLLGNADEDSERQDAYIAVMLDRQVDGLLVAPAAGKSPELARAARSGTPIVLVDRAVAGIEAPVVRAAGAVAVDNLVAHLLRLGHERLAIIAGPRDLTTSRERLEAFQAALARRNRRLPPAFVEVGDFRSESGRLAMERLLAVSPPPSAVFVADNLMTLGAMRALQNHGLRAGIDVAIASFDDIPWFDVCEPRMTAIAQPTAQLGRAAVDALLARIAGKVPSSTTLQCHLVVRRSCGERAGDDAL